MSEARSGFQTPSEKPQIRKLTVALQKVGYGNSGEISYGAGAEGLPSSSYCLLLKMGRSRSTQPDNRPLDPQIPVDERNHSL